MKAEPTISILIADWSLCIVVTYMLGIALGLLLLSVTPSSGSSSPNCSSSFVNLSSWPPRKRRLTWILLTAIFTLIVYRRIKIVFENVLLMVLPGYGFFLRDLTSQAQCLCILRYLGRWYGVSVSPFQYNEIQHKHQSLELSTTLAHVIFPNI